MAPAAPSSSAPEGATASAAPTTPPAPPPTLTQGSASPDPAPPLPTVKILAPAKDAVIPSAKAGDTLVKLDVMNWKTAKGDAHVHLILDSGPYKPIFDPKTEVVKLSGPDGGNPAGRRTAHILVAFPSRANHESVKTKGAIAVVPFWVGKKAGKAAKHVARDTTKPMLIASRPKGEYKGDMANHVLVDYQLLNDTLAAGKDHVHIQVNGPGTPDTGLSADSVVFGPPFYLDNLHADGSYTLKLDLLGPDGKPLAGSWNSVTLARLPFRIDCLRGSAFAAPEVRFALPSQNPFSLRCRADCVACGHRRPGAAGGDFLRSGTRSATEGSRARRLGHSVLRTMPGSVRALGWLCGHF